MYTFVGMILLLSRDVFFFRQDAFFGIHGFHLKAYFHFSAADDADDADFFSVRESYVYMAGARYISVLPETLNEKVRKCV